MAAMAMMGAFDKREGALCFARLKLTSPRQFAVE